MSIEELYPRVTEAIERAQALVDAGDAIGARRAYHEVFTIESEIATKLAGSTIEGAIARCGAVRAALKANRPDLARNLALEYLEDRDLTPDAQAELRKVCDRASGLS